MSDRAALVLARGETCPVEGGETPRWRRRPAGSRLGAALKPARPRRRWTLALAALAGCAALALAVFGARDSSFSLELRAGCDELSHCSRLESEAERRLLDCWLVCGREVVELERARLLRYKAEERSLVRDHYEQRDAAERAEALATAQRRLAALEREEAARQRASEREHERRMELERLRQEHADRALARERARRLSYLSLLGPEGREQRLRRCHIKATACDALVLDLVDSTTDAAEQRALAALHERLLSGLEPRSATRRASPRAEPAAATPASSSPAPRAQPVEVESVVSSTPSS